MTNTNRGNCLYVVVVPLIIIDNIINIILMHVLGTTFHIDVGLISSQYSPLVEPQQDRQQH